MISQAIALAIITFGGFFILFKKLPKKIKDFILKHDLAVDVATLGAAYILLGGTLTALFAAAIVGLFVSAGLYIHKNQEDFQYLWDIADMIKTGAKKVQEALKEFGVSYRQKKLIGEENG